MVDQRSIEMLAFNFASRTFAYKRLAQGLSRALSAFSSFMREYLDKVIKADQCAQYVDDIGIAANSVTQLIRNTRAVFECIRHAGLIDFTIHRQMPFWSNRGRIPWKNDHPTRNRPPQDHKIQKFLANVRFPKSKKQVQRYIGFVNYYRNYIPRLSEKLLGFYELLKVDKQIKVTEELLDHYKAINAALAEACGLALKQPITGRQYVLMTDASFRASGYALMIEEENDKKTQLQKENFCTCSNWIKSIFTGTTEDVNLLQRISGNLPRVPRIQPHIVGNNPTNSRNDRQQISNEVFPNKSDSPHTMECM